MLLSEQKDFIREHYAETFGVDSDDFLIYPAHEDDEIDIDIICIKPTKDRDYYVLATCGMCQYVMEEPTTQLVELVMFLPADWRVEDKRDEWTWPVKLLINLAYTPFYTGQNISFGTVLTFTDDNEPFTKGTKNCGAIITFPENLPEEFFEVETDTDEIIRFFTAVPITKDDIEKMQENGLDKFIKFDLRNADGPDLIVKKR